MVEAGGPEWRRGSLRDFWETHHVSGALPLPAWARAYKADVRVQKGDIRTQLSACSEGKIVLLQSRMIYLEPRASGR